jgi:hypothetical protein
MAPNTLASQPNLYPTICLTRIVTGLFDVVNDGISPSLYAFNFTLTQVPQYTELTALYQTYCIEQVEVWFRPEYTELTDASALSNAVNVELCSAIDTVDGTTPTSISDVQAYQSVAHTGITFNHYRKIKPSYLMDNVAPTCTRVTTASPNLRWYGLKVAVPPCGTAMTFRSTVKYKIVVSGLK